MAESAEITALRKKLAEANDAYHRLMCGDKEVEVNFGVNRGTKWTPADAPRLQQYISKLEHDLARLTGTGGSQRRAIFPMGGPR